MENIIGTFGALVKVRLTNPRPRPFLIGDGIQAYPGTVEVDLPERSSGSESIMVGASRHTEAEPRGH